MALVKSKIQKFSGGACPPPKDILGACPTITDILATPLPLCADVLKAYRVRPLLKFSGYSTDRKYR